MASPEQPAFATGVAPPPRGAPPGRRESRRVVTAALALATLLIVYTVCLRLARRPPLGGRGQAETFQGWTQYRPACSGQWLSERRGACRGLTTGDMPSIENDLPISWQPCAGTLGVPPPTYH